MLFAMLAYLLLAYLQMGNYQLTIDKMGQKIMLYVWVIKLKQCEDDATSRECVL